MTDSLKCVVDASVAIKKFIIEPLTPKVDQLFAHLNDPNARLYIPDLFYIECTTSPGNIFVLDSMTAQKHKQT